eukprot:1144466-Pelagomonas_calceolata.AAC.5
MDSEALNGAGKVGGTSTSPEADGLLDPLGLWDPTPPMPMNGKGPQWGSKIRVGCIVSLILVFRVVEFILIPHPRAPKWEEVAVGQHDKGGLEVF